MSEKRWNQESGIFIGFIIDVENDTFWKHLFLQQILESERLVTIEGVFLAAL